jgi:type IV secretion system protein VirB6
MDNIFQFLFDSLLGNLTNYITTASGEMASAVSGLGFWLFGIYILLWCIAFGRGQVSEPVGDFIKTVVRGSLIYLIATNGAYYADFVIDLFWTLPTSLSQYVAFGNATFVVDPQNAPVALGQAFDKILAQIFNVGLTIWNKMSILEDFKSLLYGAIALSMWLCGITITSIAAGLVIISLIMLALTLALGPLFICFAFFDATKGIFEAWLKTTINYALYGVVIISIVSMVMTFMTSYAQNIESFAEAGTLNDAAWGSVNLGVFTILACYLLFKADDMAGSMAGTVSAGVGNFARGVMSGGVAQGIKGSFKSVASNPIKAAQTAASAVVAPASAALSLARRTNSIRNR